jgi:predicted DNA-binding transcriptional regulator YafY
VVGVDSSPTARALRTLELLQRMPGISAGQLAYRLGVTERAARRYVAILRQSGIAVQSSRGPHGGYRLGRGLRLPPLVFTAAEALGLVMAVLDGQHAAADADDPVGSALGRLIGALPDGVGRPAATMREHALSVPSRNPARPDPTITSALVDAVAARQRTVVSYRSAAGREYETAIDPWAVVVRYARWYVLCFAHSANAVRTLRIDRIRAVEAASETFDPPVDLDPVALLEQHLGAGWPYRFRVVFQAAFADVDPWVTAPMGRLTPIDDGARCVLVGSTNNPQAYAGERLAAIPYAFTVEEGPELQDAVRMLATRLTTATRGQKPTGSPSARSAAPAAPRIGGLANPDT